MSTRVEDVADRSRLELFEGSDRVGWLKYQRAQDVLVLEHTEVDRSHEGHEYGGQPVRSALDLAKAEGRRVIVVCPYAKVWMQRHRDYADLDYTRDGSSPHP
jgi:predicted GNAT family acetyltransferase